MFNHVSVGVTDISASVGFYDALMKVLGHERFFGNIDEGFMAYGSPESFFVINIPLDEGETAAACPGSHICFHAQDKETVDRFYKVAIELGAKDGGGPGWRPHYSEDYYAAFIYDPDGHMIEAMASVPPL